MGKSRQGKKVTSGVKFNTKTSGLGLLRKHRKGNRTPRRTKVSKEVPLQCRPWEFKVNQNDWFQGKVNVKPSDLIADILRQRLTDEQTKIFRSTCFGFYLDLPEIAVNPQLIHQVLLREVCQPNDQEIYFQIGCDTVRFGIDEFQMITGLRCTGEVNRAKYASTFCRIRSQYFSHLTNITNDDIFHVFTSMSNRNNRDVVIMGILFLVSHLMMNTAYDRFVDETLLVMVDSLDMKFYPWGKDIYKQTFASLQQALRNKQVTIEGEGRPTMSYRLNGFIIAFQIWIYETIPMLESKICFKIASRRPRILNWSSEGEANLPSLNLATDVFNSPQLRAVRLIPQVAEALDPYYIALKQERYPVAHHQNTSTPSVGLEDDDDDFVLPPAKNVTRFNQNLQCDVNKVTSTKTSASDSVIADDSHVSIAKSDSGNSKGKELVYALDSSDEECEIVNEHKIRPRGNYYNGESSNDHNGFHTELQDFPQSSESVLIDTERFINCSGTEQNPILVASGDCQSKTRAGYVAATHTLNNACDDSSSHLFYPQLQMTGLQQVNGSGTVSKSKSLQGNLESDPMGVGTCKRHKFTTRLNEKYALRFKSIISEHAKLAEENFILKMKVQELVKFVHTQIQECIAGIQLRSSNNQTKADITKINDISGSKDSNNEVRCSTASPNYVGKVKRVAPTRDSVTPSIKSTVPKKCKPTPAITSHRSTNFSKFSNPGNSTGERNDIETSARGNIITTSTDNSPSCNKASIGSSSWCKPSVLSKNNIKYFPDDYSPPSFDLGIENHTNDDCVVLDDGLVLTESHFKHFDAIVQEKISSRDKHQESKSKTPQRSCADLSNNISLKHTGYPSDHPSLSSTKTASAPSNAYHITPVKMLRSSRSIDRKLHYEKTNDSNHINTQTDMIGIDTAYDFVYKTCMDKPAEEDIVKFKKFYRSCLKVKNSQSSPNRNRSFTTNIVEIPHETTLGPITIQYDMWWHDLYEVGEPLHDTHIDVAFYFIRMLLKLRTSSKIRATTTDCNFDGKIRGISTDILLDAQAVHKHNSLFSYPKGMKIPFNTPWTKVDHVLIPMWIHSPGHWILAHFDINNWCLDIYNSYNKIIQNGVVYKSIRPMLIALPILARSLNSTIHKFPGDPLQCRIIDSCSQQQNGGDCGIFVIKYSEFLIDGKIEEMPKSLDTAYARSNIATQMYKYMIEEPDIILFNGARSVNLKE